MPKRASNTTTEPVEAVGRALKILELFQGRDAPIRLRDVSAALELSPSSAHRLLATLAHFGYVRHDANAHVYFIGDALLSLANSLQFDVALRSGARRELTRLIEKTNGSTGFAVLRDAQAYFIDVEYNAGTPARPDVGYAAALTTTASGRALLAASPMEFDTLVRSKRIVPDPAFLRELEASRTRGFASSFGETIPGVSAVASAIVSSSGRLYGVLSVVIFGETIWRDRLMNLGGELRASCARVAEPLP